ncbi:Hypothetical protein R9X50_00414900 [Acrodontium crateriforme]|uniref:Amidohydrolase-related domain-containing protein n=1 Tax=Acrodontium crateriforme TaxID=150365 RepID=A0AAQ3M5M2_9PEZI|nr:Hypothetical protein R9X50_00414900 [Acrodontium crateriforme]
MAAKVLANGVVLTFDESTQSIAVLPKASVLIIQDRIAAISENLDPAQIPSGAEIIDVEGRIVSPGFINTHVHSWQSIYRTLGPNIVLANYFDWLSQVSTKVNDSFTAEDVYISSLQAYREGLNSGVTTYVEHAHNNWGPEFVNPGYRGAADSGARVWWCYDVYPRSNFSSDEQWSILKDIATNSVPLVPMGLSLDGVSGAFFTGDEFERAKQSIDDLKLEVFTLHHMGGPWPTGGKTSPTAVCTEKMHETGLPIIFSHAPYLTPEDMSKLREHDMFISITPESECQFGHGQETGHLISDQASLGIDTNWTFSGDLTTQARLWLQMTRRNNYKATLDRGLLPNGNPATVEQAFLMATRQGGRALRRSDIGVIKVGAKADIVVFNGESPNMLGWSDPIAAIILHSNSGDIEHVIVDGQFRKRNFRLVDGPLNEADVKIRFLEASRRIQGRLSVPPPLPEKLWGCAELGDVATISTTVT